MVAIRIEHGDIGASDQDLQKLLVFISNEEYVQLKQVPMALRKQGVRLNPETLEFPDIMTIQDIEREEYVIGMLKRWMVEATYWWHDETAEEAKAVLSQRGYSRLSIAEYMKMTKQKQLVYHFDRALAALRQWQAMTTAKLEQEPLGDSPPMGPMAQAGPASESAGEDLIGCGQPVSDSEPPTLAYGVPESPDVTEDSLVALVGSTLDGIMDDEESSSPIYKAVWTAMDETPDATAAAGSQRAHSESGPKRRRTSVVDSSFLLTPRLLHEQFGSKALGGVAT